MSIVFRSQFDRVFARDSAVDRFYHHTGSGIVQRYRGEYDKTGVLQLVPDGESDLYAEIQSHAASTDMEYILSRYFGGDPSVLSRVQGMYGDFSGMPASVHEAMTLFEQGREHFESLPVEVKEAFNFDPNQWLAALGTDEWRQKMQMPDVAAAEAPAVPSSAVQSEVKSDES